MVDSVLVCDSGRWPHNPDLVASREVVPSNDGPFRHWLRRGRLLVVGPNVPG